jgi:hypothetical protein
MRLGVLKEGRKSLILVSEGYSNALPGPASDYGGLGWRLTQPPSTQPPTDLSRELLEISNLANRNNVAIYTVDPRGLVGSELNTMQTLRALAEDSDGRAIVNRNDVTLAMKQIVIDSSAYYLIGYNSTTATPDGKFHEIRIAVKRSGIDVRHRKGYWAFKPEDMARLATPTPVKALSIVEAALAATAVPPSRFIRTWIGAERGQNGNTRVTFVWEPMPARPGEPVRASERPVRVAVTASGSDGSRYFSGAVPESTTPVPTLASGALVTFEAPPGMLQLRLTVEGDGRDVLDSEIRDVVVPDLTAPHTLLGTPEVYRARTLADLQRLRSDLRPMPTAARDFARTETLLFRIPVYGPAGTTPTLTARLLNRAGQPMADLAIAAPAVNRPSLQVEVSLARLPAGEYGLALTATGEGGEASEIVVFRVVP